jgi:hypothetical protein
MAPLLINRDGVSIVIQSREHLPPHVHASSGEDEALINIRTGEIFAGSIDGKKLRIVREWLAEDGRREIVEENFYELNPGLRPKKEMGRQAIKKAIVKKKGKYKGGKQNEK